MSNRNIASIGILVLFNLFFLRIQAQVSSPFFSEWKVTASYFGNNLWNPGLQFSLEKVLTTKSIEKSKRDKIKIKHRQVYINGNIGFYYDNPTHLAVFNNYQVNLRRVREKGKYLTIGAGPGIVRTFLPETYEVTDNGDVVKVKYPGRLYAAPVLSFGTGRLWKRNGTFPWTLKIQNFWWLNYNNGVLPQINIEYGYHFGYRSISSKPKADSL